MCTALNFKAAHNFFGRTLDLEYHYNEEVVVTPKNYEIDFKYLGKKRTKYAIIGMATVVEGRPLYYEASNEKGLSIGGLNFPGNAVYFDAKKDCVNLPLYELIPYALGFFENVDDLENILKKINLTNDNLNENMPSSPLHFMACDKERCIVIEQTRDGLHYYENETGVMTNNPTFPCQMENLKKYESLTNKYIPAREEKDGVSFYCVGCGALGLPGDYSSMSRFVKTAFMNKTAERYEKEEENVSQFFHILDSVSFVKGSVLTKNNMSDMTVYSSCINTDKGIYYYKTYNNNMISAVKLTDENKNAKSITRFKLNDSEKISFHN